MLNKIEYQGRLTADVDLKQTQSGVSFTEFTIAWSEKYKEVETKCFLRCKAWRQTAEFISKYFNKGKKILVAGRIEVDKYENEKGKHTVTKVIIEEVEFVEKKEQDEFVEEQDEVINIPDDNDLPF
jgi:single-strand DNA-binding protein